jgi:flagellar basal-body rod modification protein FlgD
MPVDSVSASQSSSQTATATNRSTLSANFDTFLRLLTAQLQHQDPTNPMDTAEFTQQLVQYSQVEQQIGTNEKMADLISLQRATAGSAAVGYLGKTVVTQGAQASLQNGAAKWIYELPRSAASAQLLITDAKGRVVRNIPGELSAGAHPLSWDGKNANGTTLPDGTYTLEVRAAGVDGNAIAASLKSEGIVTEADLSQGDPMLSVAGRKVSLREVLAIRN